MMKSIFSEEEILQAGEVLRYLKEHKGFNIGHRPRPEGSGCMQRKFLNDIMCDDLGLVRHTGDIYSLTALGREAAEVGFRAWLQEQERKAKEPVQVRKVEDETQRRYVRWELWASVISALTGIILLAYTLLRDFGVI